MAALDLRPGAMVLYSPVHTDEWREGKLVKVSTTNEEWLVKNRFGKFWVHVSRLRPPHDGAQPDHDQSA
ncbi:MAG TPA: hypothetical protein VM052_08425 [Candidatus Limnocylindrales bacterium]|nr:hypothetical protein [Candidatus Limnocylindrales bacterium]